MSKNQFMCGAAIRDITPTEVNGVLPMPAGFSANVREMTAVHDPLALRVIALKDERQVVLIVSMDVVNLDGNVFCPALSEHTGIPTEALFFIETTAHSTIRAGKEARNGDSPEGLAKMEIYVNLVKKQLFSAADEALANLKPARVGIGRSESYVNVCRDTPFWTTDGGEKHVIWEVGANPGGVSDRTVEVLRFEDEEGNPIAFFIDYAIFNVLMDDNNAGKNGTGAISADLGGYVSTHVEDAYPGCVAMWCGGANCDQNPVVKAKMFYSGLPSGGRSVRYLSPEDCSTALDLMGSINFNDTLRAIDAVEEMKDDVAISYAYGTMDLPGRSQKVERAEGSEFEQVVYGPADDFTLHMTLLRIGDIAIAFHRGSIYSSIGIHMKENSILKDTLVATGYVNSLVPHDGPICDDDALIHGGHDADRARYRPGFINEAMSLLMNQLITETELEPYKASTWRWTKVPGEEYE